MDGRRRLFRQDLTKERDFELLGLYAAEIIFDDFGRKDTFPLNNRGQTFVSLSGFLEILSKTELSSGELPTRFGRWVVRKLKLTKDEIDTVVSNDGINCSVDSRVQSLNLVSESGLYDLFRISFATVQTDVKNLTSVNPLFDFNATHNGEACIESLDPKDRGTERRLRFTRALLCTLLGVKKEDTITNHVDKLLERGVVTVTKNLVTVKIANSVGAIGIVVALKGKILSPTCGGKRKNRVYHI